ncbi:Inactive histone-lysine N-methyltransferase [Actinidia chinensis var. chinensis]|uniref:Inactive histone-lysine N-methyltransferase n=1 Tax=Actinidia chinensis var. chinensis TaxID=1590841 RepID=A0A2R6RTI8_ACTCC|nr:Inactive histone-lysine N-methyltransferase [Actinidia chinensis var. chinensis]
MAPRGRPRKRRLMRMDAAVDHMGLYGFPEELVRGSVKSLLKEYGGDDGWPFIEENGYMVLLNDILKEQDERIAGENSNEEENLLLDVAPGDEIPGDNFVAADAGPSSLVRLPICSGVANNATQTMETEVRGRLLAAEGGGKGQTDIASDQNCNEKDMVVASGNNEQESAQTMELDNTPVQSSPFVVPSATRSNDLPIRSCKPCFGWISNDDEEADFIKLIPAKPASRPENRDSGMVKKPKRKTRWDEGPNDSGMVKKPKRKTRWDVGPNDM